LANRPIMSAGHGHAINKAHIGDKRMLMSVHSSPGSGLGMRMVVSSVPGLFQTTTGVPLAAIVRQLRAGAGSETHHEEWDLVLPYRKRLSSVTTAR
jgi:hypothetical protein